MTLPQKTITRTFAVGDMPVGASQANHEFAYVFGRDGHLWVTYAAPTAG